MENVFLVATDIGVSVGYFSTEREIIDTATRRGYINDLDEKSYMIPNQMKLCFVALNIYPFLKPSITDEAIGGAELQQIMIGRGLQRFGYDIAYITKDYGQSENEVIDGLKIIKTFKENAGLPYVRFLFPRLYTLWKALLRADADVYYCRAAGFFPGILAIFCRLYKKKFIFAGASDTDFIPKKLLVPSMRDKLLYRYGLKRANKIIVQSYNQKKLLYANMGLHGTVIRNFLDLNPKTTHSLGPKIVLWVSTIRKLKRPLQFISLARAFPHERFVMIGGPDGFEKELYREVIQKCERLPNITFLGFQPLEKTEGYFDQCQVFINTSIHEGFPNTFLHAWCRGIPVISYVDPDNIIRENTLGIVVHEEKELSTALLRILDRDCMDSTSIQKYFNNKHSSSVIGEYCALLEEIS